MYGDDPIEPQANKYYLASPMLRDQAIEMTLGFQSTSD